MGMKLVTPVADPPMAGQSPDPLSADEIKRRWIETNLRVFREKGKMVEKYDVVNPTALGGGGEYPLQDGFGWTNGVLAALLKEDEK